MPCVFSTFSATRICSARLAVCGEPEPPLARQVPMRELQAAVVAVTSVDRPVAAGLAGRDGIPVDAVRIGGAGRHAPSVPQQAHRQWWPDQTSCGCSSLRSFRQARAINTRAVARAQLPVHRQRSWVAPSRSDATGGGEKVPHRASGPVAAEGDLASRGPAHTQVRGFEIICSFWRRSDVTKAESD